MRWAKGFAVPEACGGVAFGMDAADNTTTPENAKLHVSTLLVASERALSNALDELGFAQDDDVSSSMRGGSPSSPAATILIATISMP